MGPILSTRMGRCTATSDSNRGNISAFLQNLLRCVLQLLISAKLDKGLLVVLNNRTTEAYDVALSLSIRNRVDTDRRPLPITGKYLETPLT